MFLFFLLSCKEDEIANPPSKTEPITFPNDPQYDTITAAIRQEMESFGAENGAWAIFNREEILHTAAFGSFEDGSALTPNALFRIGSLSKSMTALAVLQQVDEGLYSLEDHVSDLFPNLNMTLSPNEFEQLQVLHLLTHQGSLVDYTVVEGPIEPDGLADFVEGMLTSNLFLIAPPGRFWNYSNPNYYLAGYLAEQHGDLHYSDLMQQRVFDPLGMNSTFVRSTQVEETDLWATGVSQGETITPNSYDNAWAAPAGFIWSSVMDLSLWGQFLLNGNESILSEDLRQGMTDPIISTRMLGSMQSYGYGMFSAQGIYSAQGYHPLNWSYHGGDIPGYTTDLFIIPEHDIGFVFLAGADYAHLTDSLLDLLSDLDLLGAPQPTPDEWYPRADLSVYAGTYFDNWNVGEIQLEDNDTHLTVTMPRLEEYSVSYDPIWQPYSIDTFLTNIDGNDILIGFVEENGVMQYVTHRAFVAHRSGEAPPAALPRPPDLSGLKSSSMPYIHGHSQRSE
ncbi:MAG: hypothetical protein CMK59_12415 [Proteobacteria bacterium]|nr:hypothetical protein [Pseudomonadota bacterium]